MPFLQLFILGVAAMAALAVSRVVVDNIGRAPRLDGIRSLLVIVAFLFVPPIAYSLVMEPGAGGVRAFALVPLYGVLLAGIVVVMWFAAQVVRSVARGRARPLLLLALVGNKGENDDVPFDPPVTVSLALSVAQVDRANAVFPRGPDFAAQVERSGYQFSWDALDTATRTLETGIADDRRRGLPVASGAISTALDARNRLDTLKRLAAVQLRGTATA